MISQIAARQLPDTRIECDKRPVLLRCMPEEQSIRPLLVSSYVGSGHCQPGVNIVAHRPKLMPRIVSGLNEELPCGYGANCALAYSRIGQQPQHSELGEHIGCPSLPARVHEPPCGCSMAFVARPDQCEKDIDIRQMTLHSSAKSSRTRSVVIAGKSAGTSNIGKPLTFRTPI